MMLMQRRRIKAAATSVCQFYAQVRALLRDPVDDATVEIATLYLHQTVAAEVFGRRFALRSTDEAMACLRYSTPEEAVAAVTRMRALIDALDRAPDPTLDGPETVYEHRVRSIIRGLFLSAGRATADPEEIKAAFVPLERVLERFKAHLRGIKRQNYLLLR